MSIDDVEVASRIDRGRFARCGTMLALHQKRDVSPTIKEGTNTPEPDAAVAMKFITREN